MNIRSINGGYLHNPPHPQVISHCLLLQEDGHSALIDTGIGLLDIRQGRIAPDIARARGFQFVEANTVAAQLAAGEPAVNPDHLILTHADPDHAGGVSDFPGAVVHMSTEEYKALASGHYRYIPAQFSDDVRWELYSEGTDTWFGLEARRLRLPFASAVFLIPLFGHTEGHCGVAIETDEGWILQAGDAIFLEAELLTNDHPVSALSAGAATDNKRRLRSLDVLRRLHREQPHIRILTYHDPTGWKLP